MDFLIVKNDEYLRLMLLARQGFVGVFNYKDISVREVGDPEKAAGIALEDLEAVENIQDLDLLQ